MNPVALKLAQEIKALCFIDQDNGRGDEVRIWATLDEDVVAELIADALAQARLEGAKAMQEATQQAVRETDLKRVFQINENIRALDPQQVINESHRDGK